jgi:hypothetical protein
VLRRRSTAATDTDAAGGDSGHDQRGDDPSEESHDDIMPDAHADTEPTRGVMAVHDLANGAKPTVRSPGRHRTTPHMTA